jgi:23S rRNA (cytosine1962-C5)-methyltransferase
LPKDRWDAADGIFSREDKEGWRYTTSLPEAWAIEIDGMKMRIQPTDFGHVGLFPEQRPFWKAIREITSLQPSRILNLFAYSGGSTIAAAQGGASVCHLDASKGIVQWARENAALNDLSSAPIRWIVEDVTKFLKREERRSSLYDGIILDPPSFGRGAKGEVFKIEEEILPLLSCCRSCLSTTPKFILFSCHTQGFTPLTLHHLLEDAMSSLSGTIETGEMILANDTNNVRPVPSGTYALWRSL